MIYVHVLIKIRKFWCDGYNNDNNNKYFYIAASYEYNLWENIDLIISIISWSESQLSYESGLSDNSLGVFKPMTYICRDEKRTRHHGETLMCYCFGMQFI